MTGPWQPAYTDSRALMSPWSRPSTSDDGGLLDLDGLSDVDLARFCELDDERARQAAAALERLGRRSSVEELVVHAALPHDVAERLREYAAFSL